MSGPLRRCGRAECRLCNPVPVEEPSEGLAEALVGMAAIVLLAVVFFVILPVLA